MNRLSRKFTTVHDGWWRCVGLADPQPRVWILNVSIFFRYISDSDHIP